MTTFYCVDAHELSELPAAHLGLDCAHKAVQHVSNQAGHPLEVSLWCEDETTCVDVGVLLAGFVNSVASAYCTIHLGWR